jgi:hypothetical protein
MSTASPAPIHPTHGATTSSLMSTHEYIRKYNLAALVDILVQQVIEERPEDPYTFLADRVRLEATLRAKGRSVAPTV